MKRSQAKNACDLRVFVVGDRRFELLTPTVSKRKIDENTRD